MVILKNEIEEIQKIYDESIKNKEEKLDKRNLIYFIFTSVMVISFIGTILSVFLFSNNKFVSNVFGFCFIVVLIICIPAGLSLEHIFKIPNVEEPFVLQVKRFLENCDFKPDFKDFIVNGKDEFYFYYLFPYKEEMAISSIFIELTNYGSETNDWILEVINDRCFVTLGKKTFEKYLELKTKNNKEEEELYYG